MSLKLSSMSTSKRVRYSTRTLLAGITLVAILLAAFGLRSMHSIRDQHIATEIQRLGGRFDYANYGSVRDLPWCPRLIARLAYEDFSRITHVSVDGTAVTNDDLAQLGSLSHLQGIDISNTQITDAGLDHLAKNPNLQYVNAHKTNLTEGFVSDLRKRRPNLVVDWKSASKATEPSDARENSPSSVLNGKSTSRSP